jgi:hypothetical protein
MRKRPWPSAFFLFWLAVTAGTAAAQEIDSPYRFLDAKQAAMVFGGYMAAGEGTLGIGPKGGPIFGARYNIMISGPFALEGDLGWFPSTRAVMDTVPGDTTRRSIGEVDMALVIASAALRFNLTGPRTWHGLMPYLVFGAGAAFNTSGDQEPDSELPSDVRLDFNTSFLGEIGGGIEWVMGERFGFRLDARNLLWKLKTPRAFLIKGEQARLLPADEWAQNFSLTAGLVFRF